MFLENKYSLWYYKIVNRAKSREISGYTEKHHVIPKSLGGSNQIDNLVVLTAKEHFVCHHLLTKMTTGKDFHKMTIAFCMMLVSNKSQNRINARQFENTKILAGRSHSILTKDKPKHTAQSKALLSTSRKGKPSPNKGKQMSEEQKRKLSEANKGKRPTPETVAKILNSRKGYKHSDETKAKISASNKGRIVIISDETKAKISISSKGIPRPWLKNRQVWNTGLQHSDASIQKMKDSHKHREQLECIHCEKILQKCHYVRWHGDNCKAKSS